jgi:hypothetical protein
MIISVERFISDDDATCGILRVDGKFQCFTLEDEYRETKLAKETRIPAGNYVVNLRNEGSMTKRYARRFPTIHSGMLWLQDVDLFSYIYIHVGNTDDHTEGCILVGTGCSTRYNDMSISHSVLAYVALYSKVVGAAERGQLTIEITDND